MFFVTNDGVDALGGDCNNLRTPSSTGIAADDDAVLDGPDHGVDIAIGCKPLGRRDSLILLASDRPEI